MAPEDKILKRFAMERQVSDVMICIRTHWTSGHEIEVTFQLNKPSIQTDMKTDLLISLSKTFWNFT